MATERNSKEREEVQILEAYNSKNGRKLNTAFERKKSLQKEKRSNLKDSANFKRSPQLQPKKIKCHKEKRKGPGSTTSSDESDTSEDSGPLKIGFDKIKDHYDSLHLIKLYDMIRSRGICPYENIRLYPVRKALEERYRGRRLTDIVLNYQYFKKITKPVKHLMLKVLENKLPIRDIDDWVRCISFHYDAVKQMTGQKLTVRLTSTDGQKLQWGSTKHSFPINEYIHIVNYLIALETIEFSTLHETIGLSPKSCSEWSSDNPLEGVGAVTVASHVFNIVLDRMTQTEKHDTMKKWISNLCGGAVIAFDSKTFINLERKKEYLTALLTWALGHQKDNVTCTNVEQVIQFYTECSSFQIDAEALSIFGATLANGGVSATVGGKVFSSECVAKVLSIMSLSSKKPSVPIVASSSGTVLIIIPAIFGLVVRSNDTKASNLIVSSIFQHYALNPYERKFLFMGTEKTTKCQYTESVLFNTAVIGDVLTLASLMYNGMELNARDYMGRTTLHVAAAKGHFNYVAYLLNYCPQLLTTTDLMERSPIEEAIFFNHTEVVELLKALNEKLQVEKTRTNSTSNIPTRK